MFPVHDGKLSTLWSGMDAEKGDLVSRSENYGLWTIPSITMDTTEHDEGEAPEGHVVVGSRLVNHLSNRIADTMFPHDRPFYTYALTPESQLALEKEIGADNSGKMNDIIRQSTAKVEEVGMRLMKMTAYRPMAVMTLKHMIITGNAMIKRQRSNARIVYGIRDYCVRRDIEGSMTEALLKDNKRFGNLKVGVQEVLRSARADYTEDSLVVLYSHYKLMADGRWQFQQAADNVMLAAPQFFVEKDLPILPLTWSLAKGENYGRGLVEDNAIAFHNLNVLTEALIDLMGIMADLKFLVKPGSMLDVEILNASARGSYHVGNEGDITVPEIVSRGDIVVIADSISKWERELSQAFLLNSASTRDAERVTAEEIRVNARELESAYGGLYSKLALEWQQSEADYVTNKIDFQKHLGAQAKLFEVVVVTGLESLSREGQLDALRLALADLQMLDTVPEEIRAVINPLLFASFVFTNRGVKLENFLFTQQEITANQQARAQQEQDAMNAQAQANVVEEGGKAVVAQDQP